MVDLLEKVNSAINYTDRDNTRIVVISGVSSSLSVLGALVIFATYIAIPEIRNFTRKLVLCLTTADLLTAGGLLVAIIHYPTMKTNSSTCTNHVDLCLVQGTITAYSTMVSFFLTVCISLHILLTVVTWRDSTGTRGWLIGFNLLSWGVPAVVMVFALLKNAIGEDANVAGPWCWIRSKQVDGCPVNTYLWQWLTVKGWEIACYLITTTLYITLKFYLCRYHGRQGFQTIQCSLRDEDQNFLYVWLILYIIRLWGTLRFLLVTYANHGHSSEITKRFLYLQAFGDPAQAFCNCFLFCVCDSTVRSKLAQMCSRRKNNEQRDALIDERPAISDSVTSNDSDRRSSIAIYETRNSYPTASDYGSISQTVAHTTGRHAGQVNYVYKTNFV